MAGQTALSLLVALAFAAVHVLGPGLTFLRATPRSAWLSVADGVSVVAPWAILAVIADTMIPEAFETAHESAGLVTAAGFLTSFALSKLGGGG